jgi:hypothetical protein
MKPRQRRLWPLVLAALVFAVAAVAVMLTAGHHVQLLPAAPASHASATSRPVAQATPLPRVTPRPTDRPTASPTPVPALTPTPFAVLPSQPADLAQATAVAKDFLVGYGTYRYDDPPTAMEARLRADVTDQLDAQLKQGGAAGTGAGGQALVASHQVVTTAVLDVQSTGLAPDGRLVMVGHVSRTTTTTAGTATTQAYVELFLARTPQGWRVDEVDG